MLQKRWVSAQKTPKKTLHPIYGSPKTAIFSRIANVGNHAATDTMAGRSGRRESLKSLRSCEMLLKKMTVLWLLLSQLRTQHWINSWVRLRRFRPQKLNLLITFNNNHQTATAHRTPLSNNKQIQTLFLPSFKRLQKSVTWKKRKKKVQIFTKKKREEEKRNKQRKRKNILFGCKNK
jgi:hypothetical protein